MQLFGTHEAVLKQDWKHLKMGLVWFHVVSFDHVVSFNCFNASEEKPSLLISGLCIYGQARGIKCES